MNRSRRVVQPFLLAVSSMLIWACAGAQPQAPVAEPPGIAAAPGRCIDALPDTDRDGLADACELALSQAFAPLLMMHATRCTLPAPGSAQRVAGGYFHAAQPAQGVVRLVYMPAYYRDCGWTGLKCVLVDCSGHAGDSELIVVDVRRNQNGAWYTDAVFLSAHCFGRSEGGCRWYRGADLERFEWVDDLERGAPVVWVSDGRNANYPSYAACERGHWRMDSCARDSTPWRFPVTTGRDIGSRVVPLVDGEHPAGCVSGRFVEPSDELIVAPDDVECFWTMTSDFGGWQGAAAGATAYGEYLDRLGL